MKRFGKIAQFERNDSEDLNMLFSIIIPMYNAKSTLDQCLASILQQSAGDYQVLIVDDGSTDESLNLAREYEDRDTRFSVVSMPHKGAGAARNKGLTYAVGEYVIYMDADDYWVRDDLLQTLQDRIEAHPADVFMFQMSKVTEDGRILERYAKPPFTNADAVMELGEVYQDLVKDGQTLAAAWNKCVRRDLLLEHEIRFREDVLGEDIDWVLQLFSHVRTICLVNIWAYAYTQHKAPSRSTRSDAPNDLVAIVSDWARRCTGGITHAEAVGGILAFEYGICMGNHHLLSNEKKKVMREHVYLLEQGLDNKTKLICRFYRVFGYRLTCMAIRVYLFLRRIW